MNRKVILLAIISCINADHLNRNLLPPDLPPANVANIYHESGITFVSPTTHLEIASSLLSPRLPVTHAFGFVSRKPNGPQELVRTHSSQLITHGLHSPVSALSSTNGIQSNFNGQITSHRNEVRNDGHSPQISLDAHVTVQSPPSDVVHARFVENEHHAVHEINSRTQHFEYKVPFPRTVPQHRHNEHHEHNFDYRNEFDRQKPIVKHSAYGVPSDLSSQIPSEAPTFIPSHVSSSAPSQIPSDAPTFIPSHVPSSAPSQIPSDAPTFMPSHVPSSAPSQIPLETPTFLPPQVSSSAPSQIPSQVPSETPTFIPSNTPSRDEFHEPTFIPTQQEIDALPVFQNDKFLSPFARRTKTPITHSNIEPSPQTIDSIFDVPFQPTARTRVNTFEPSVHSTNTPTTRTNENIIGGNHQYANRFSLSDGTKVSEQGKLISPQAGWENVIAKTGEYEYVSPEGIPVKVKWIADHEGFRVLN
ncbi:anti-sigma-I factor RsgI2-like isoform X1 [Bradysia coprophila]|uniref:anti-sigma-I factor RsgI2-like isoform X1 n=1 Tax=Bradysia coprophila TaxID=38358 RepID=UPI00187D9FA3|nr:anti-sigma-I factor RsgI2-like isoform X1 [Bradysia coprophila]